MLVVVVLIFGTKKLRNLGTDLGGAVKGFKEGMKTEEDKGKADAAAKLEHSRLPGRRSKARSRTRRIRNRHPCAMRRALTCSTSAFPSWSSSASWR